MGDEADRHLEEMFIPDPDGDQRCPMCGKDYRAHPACIGCDSPEHEVLDCPLIAAYDEDGDNS